MRLSAGVILGVFVAASAHAQSTYVGASFIGDVVRMSGSDPGGPNGDGEAFGGALRLGTALGDRFGVEIELARSGEIEATPPFAILAQEGFTFGSDGVFPQIFPPPDIESERQLSTISTLLWWNHEVSSRLSLAYLGGVAFTRVSSELRLSFPAVPRPPNVGIGLPRAIEQESVTYDADVVVGFEGRIGMTDHVRLVPGARLQTVPGGWAFRPGVGLQWAF